MPEKTKIIKIDYKSTPFEVEVTLIKDHEGFSLSEPPAPMTVIVNEIMIEGYPVSDMLSKKTNKTIEAIAELEAPWD